METSLSLSGSKDVDSNTTATMKRGADQMDSDCGDASSELTTSKKRFHHECEPDEAPSQANLPACHIEVEQPELITAVNNNAVIADVENKVSSVERVDVDKNASDEVTLLFTTDDDKNVFTDAANHGLQIIERNHDLKETSLERKDVITYEQIECSLASSEQVMDIVNCGSLTNVDDSSQMNEGVPITESSKRLMPNAACEREFDLEININVSHTLAEANVDSEVLNLSTKALAASDCLKTVQSSGIVGAFDVGMEIANESLDLPIDLSVGHKASPSPLSQQSNNNTPYQASCVKTECTGDPVDLFIKSNGSGSENSVRKQNEKKRVPTIKRLQDELRNEESKLVLLRKLRQNQVFYQYVIDEAHSRSMSDRHASHQHPPRLLNNGPPPQLVRGAPQLLTGNHRLGGSPHRITNSGVSINDPSSRLLPVKSQHSQPPPLVIAPQPSPTVSQMSLIGSLQNLRTLASSITTQGGSHGSPIPLINIRMPQPPAQQPIQPPPSTTIVTVPQTSNEQSPAQRQAAAKLALRKQLEKTLLQIPPPKPPPPEMNFVPNSLNGEFVILLGLEEAVKCIVDNDARAKGQPVSEVKYVFNPFQCVQCNTDFTPVWKRDRPGSRSVICERCVTTNQKRALKQEHTNRLKSAFVKALQQEQEIEQSIHGNNGSGSFGTSISNGSQFIPPISSMMTSAQSATLLSSVSSSKNSLSTGYPHRPGIDLIHSQPNALQHLLPVVPPHALIRSSSTPTSAAGSLTFNPNLFFPFPPKSVASNSTAEMQRQYLLDMIPRRSQLDLPILWRT